jgi:site-specific recombinase XerD
MTVTDAAGNIDVLLQTGVRVSELCNLGLEDVDLPHAVLTVRSGKGKADRQIALEKKAIKALAKYRNDRPRQRPRAAWGALRTEADRALHPRRRPGKED